MKQVLLLLVFISSVRCSKEKDPSVIGRWNIVESHDDIGQITYNNSQKTFIRFYSDGIFEMDTVNNHFAYKQRLKGMSRYKLISDNELRFYSTDYQDSASVRYSLDRQLLLAFGYVAEKFMK